MMAKNILKRLVCNSQSAINDGIYDIDCNLQQSPKDFLHMIKTEPHAVLIAEIKFASPSQGTIRALDKPEDVARQMILGGASALSVLTQPNMFNGLPEYLIRVRKAVNVPLLMKDIMIDHVQIDAAQKMGADFILVIQSLYDNGHLKDIDEFIDYGHKKGLGVLLEVHTQKEFQNALHTEADLIGINNRNLDTLEIDLGTTKAVLEHHEKTRPVLSESGVETPDDIRYLKRCGADAFLVGSSIMKSENMRAHVAGLVNAF